MRIVRIDIEAGVQLVSIRGAYKVLLISDRSVLQEAVSVIHGKHLFQAYCKSGAKTPQNYTPDQIKDLRR